MTIHIKLLSFKHRKNNLIGLYITVMMFYTQNILSQGWQWSYATGGWGYETQDIEIDKYGNVYQFGEFEGVMNVNGISYVSNGSNDCYIQKIDANGNLIWFKQLKGYYSSGRDKIYDFMIDELTEDIYIVGKAKQSLEIDSYNINTTTGLYICKIDLNGNVKWIKNGFMFADPGFGTIVKTSQNGLLLNEISTYSNGHNNYLSYLDTSGSLIIFNPWASGAIINMEFESRPNENYILGSIYFDSIYSDTNMVDTLVFSPDSGKTAFIGAIDSVGRLTKFKEFKSIEGVGIGGLSKLMDNSVAFYGKFSDSMTVDYQKYYGVRSTFFLGRIDTSGMVSWLRTFYDYSTHDSSIWVNSIYSYHNTIYLSGDFTGTLRIDSYTITAGNSGNSANSFVARFDSDGNCMGLIHVGPSQRGNCAIDAQGSVFLSAEFWNSIQIGSDIHTCNGQVDVFVAKADSINGLKYVSSNRKSGLVIYRNPTSGTFSIKVPDVFSEINELDMEVFDTSGKLVRHFHLIKDEQPYSFNFTELPSGVYTVIITDGSIKSAGRLVLEK